MKDNAITISVIIPVFEAEKSIDYFIASLKAQTLDGLEFIFVNDCGKDGSMDAIKKFKEEDPRVIIINNEINSGPGVSRNNGIDVARGEYLSFLDPDDYISNNFYQSLYLEAQKENKEIIKGRRENNYISADIAQRKFLSNSEMIDRLNSGYPLFCVFFHGHQSAIYKRSLFEDGSVRYGKTYYSEDSLFLLRCCLKANSISFVDDAIYYYNLNDSSITSSNSLKRLDDELSSLEEQFKLISMMQSDEYTAFFIKRRLMIFNNRLGFFINKLDEPTRKNYINRLVEIIKIIPNAPSLLNDVLEFKFLLSHKQLIPNKLYSADLKETPKLNGWAIALKEIENIDNIYLKTFNDVYFKTLTKFRHNKNKSKKPLKYTEYISNLSTKKKLVSYLYIFKLHLVHLLSFVKNRFLNLFK